MIAFVGSPKVGPGPASAPLSTTLGCFARRTGSSWATDPEHALAKPMYALGVGLSGAPDPPWWPPWEGIRGGSTPAQWQGGRTEPNANELADVAPAGGASLALPVPPGRVLSENAGRQALFEVHERHDLPSPARGAPLKSPRPRRRPIS
jgi:hypothetical protein